MTDESLSLSALTESIQKEIESLIAIVDRHAHILPGVSWLVNPLWGEAGWAGTAYQWHPTGEAPAVMGLVFDNPEKGRELFQSWTEKNGNHDELEEIKITVIEGEVPGEAPGYTVHICPDPENPLARATTEGVVLDQSPLSFLGQMRTMNPVASSQPMLPRFKAEFAKHEEFLLAPVSPGYDGQLRVDLECGIAKRTVHFRDFTDIDERIFQAAKELFAKFSSDTP